MFEVFGLGEKQSSPMLTSLLVTVIPLTLSVSHPSVFLGRADALFEMASMRTLSYVMSLVRMLKLVQHGEFRKWMPLMST